MLEKLFRLREHGTTVRTEILGGLTTFVTMAYIIVVNPAILQYPGIPQGAMTVATILAAVFGTLLMGFYANRPIAVAPYMGENAFIAFTLVLAHPPLATWQQVSAAVILSGLAFALLTMFGIRSWLAEAISPSMKHSFAVGIGLFLLLIGLYQTGIVTSAITGMEFQKGMLDGEGKFLSLAVPLKIGNLHDPRVLLALGGFALISVLMCWRVRGAILLGMAATALVGYLVGQGTMPEKMMALPFTGDYDLQPLLLDRNLVKDFAGILTLGFFPILLTLFLMSFLDTLGTLTGVGAAGGMLDEKGNFPQVERPMMVDALSCVFSGAVGTSTTGAYIESATGIREGARTGLAAVTTAGLFALSLFFLPLVGPMQKLTFAYGPALLAVGVLMMGTVTRIDFSDMTEAIPAVAALAMMVFTYNIANGLTAGLVLYPIFKVAAGRFHELKVGSIVLGLLCLVYFVFGLQH
jgi:AGZA family xanthine/uracil permease-like MFS transporter